MKASILHAAIIAMREAEKLSYTSPPAEFAEKMNALLYAAHDLERELGTLDIPVERPMSVCTLPDNWGKGWPERGT